MKAAFLAREVAQEMLNRLKLMKLRPRQIVDLGCGAGTEAQALAQCYPEAQVCGIDLAQSFLQYGKKQSGKELTWVVADSQILPLRGDSVDLIFANLLLPWVNGPTALLREWRRILRPNGLLLFSCLGPATFNEWQTIENAAFLPSLVDMHHVGDSLLTEGFADPVLEMENLTLTYRSQEQLQAELAHSGMSPFMAVGEVNLPSCDGIFPVTFEVVYGHAWCPAMKGFRPDDQGVARIPVSQLKK